MRSEWTRTATWVLAGVVFGAAVCAPRILLAADTGARDQSNELTVKGDVASAGGQGALRVTQEGSAYLVRGAVDDDTDPDTVTEGNVAFEHWADGRTYVGGAGIDGDLRIYSEQGVTDYYVGFGPHATMTESTPYVLPAADGTAGQQLQTDGAFNLSWASAAGSVALDDLSDVVVTAVGDNEVLAYDTGSGNWINQTAAEASLAAATHVHAGSDLTSGVVAHERGGLEADVSAYNGLVRISGGATTNITDFPGLDTALTGTLPHEAGGIEADISAYAGLIAIEAGSAVELKHNRAGTTAPTANEDSGDGYVVGSRWYDTTNDKEYVCLDNTLTAAVWTETTQSGGGGAFTALTDTPANYTGAAGKIVAVNATPDALEFLTVVAHEQGGLEADVSAYAGLMAIEGGATVELKHNRAGTTAPGVTDDSGSGYVVGSRWYDTTNDKEYVCLDATVSAAVWTETTQAAASGSVSIKNDNAAQGSASTIDFGAGIAATVAASEAEILLDFSPLTEQTDPAGGDWLAIEEASGGAIKKVRVDSVGRTDLEVARMLGIQSLWQADGTDTFGLNNLSVGNTPTSVAAILTNGTEAINFDYHATTGDYLNEANATVVHERFQGSQWTIGCFFSPDATRLGNFQALIGKWRTTNGFRTVLLYLDATDHFGAFVSTDGNTAGVNISDSTAALAGDVWYVGLSYDGAVYTIYVAEVGVDSTTRIVGSGTAATPFDGTEDFAVGNSGTTASTANSCDGQQQYPFYANRAWHKAQHDLFYNGGNGLSIY